MTFIKEQTDIDNYSWPYPNSYRQLKISHRPFLNALPSDRELWTKLQLIFNKEVCDGKSGEDCTLENNPGFEEYLHYTKNEIETRKELRVYVNDMALVKRYYNLVTAGFITSYEQIKATYQPLLNETPEDKLLWGTLQLLFEEDGAEEYVTSLLPLVSTDDYKRLTYNLLVGKMYEELKNVSISVWPAAWPTSSSRKWDYANAYLEVIIVHPEYYSMVDFFSRIENVEIFLKEKKPPEDIILKSNIAIISGGLSVKCASDVVRNIRDDILSSEDKPVNYFLLFWELMNLKNISLIQASDKSGGRIFKEVKKIAESEENIIGQSEFVSKVKPVFEEIHSFLRGKIDYIYNDTAVFSIYRWYLAQKINNVNYAMIISQTNPNLIAGKNKLELEREHKQLVSLYEISASKGNTLDDNLLFGMSIYYFWLLMFFMVVGAALKITCWLNPTIFSLMKDKLGNVLGRSEEAIANAVLLENSEKSNKKKGNYHSKVNKKVSKKKQETETEVAQNSDDSSGRADLPQGAHYFVPEFDTRRRAVPKHKIKLEPEASATSSTPVVTNRPLYSKKAKGTSIALYEKQFNEWFDSRVSSWGIETVEEIERYRNRALAIITGLQSGENGKWGEITSLEALFSEIKRVILKEQAQEQNAQEMGEEEENEIEETFPEENIVIEQAEVLSKDETPEEEELEEAFLVINAPYGKGKEMPGTQNKAQGKGKEKEVIHRAVFYSRTLPNNNFNRALQPLLNWCNQIHQIYNDAQETLNRSELDRKIYIRVMSAYFLVLYQRMEEMGFDNLKPHFDMHSFAVVRNGLRHYFKLEDLKDDMLITMINHLVACLPTGTDSLEKRISLRRAKTKETTFFSIFEQHYQQTHVEKKVKSSGVLIFSEDERRSLRTPQQEKIISYRKGHPRALISLSESSEMVDYFSQQIRQGNQDNNLLRALAFEYLHLAEALMPFPDKFAPSTYENMVAVGRAVAHANTMPNFSGEDLAEARKEYEKLQAQIQGLIESSSLQSGLVMGSK